MKGRRRSVAAVTWIARVVLALAVAAVFLFPPLNTLNRTRDSATIESYDASMVLSADGDLRVEEHLAVRLPSGKHGIYRIFDTKDPRRSGVDHPVTVESVERDGRPETYSTVDSAAGTQTIRIGNTGVVLTPGTHQYTIVSRTVNALEPGDKGETLWWWDVVGSGWQMPMNSVRISVQLPTAPTKVECVQDKDTKCHASIEGTAVQLETGPIDAFTPVTVRTTFPSDALPAPPGGDTSSRALTIGLSVLGGLVAAAAAALLVAQTRESEPGFPVLFEPPAGIYPALGVRVLDEAHSSDDLQATLFDLAERGLLTLEGDDDHWSISVIGDPATAQLNGAENALLGGLGLSYAGASFDVTSTKSAGERISNAKKAFRSHVDMDSKAFLDQSPAGCLGVALGWLGLIATIVQVGFHFFGDTGTVIWPLLITTAAFTLIAMRIIFDRAALTKRSATGRDIWSRMGGFARFLTTNSSESRFEAAKHMDMYPRYLPWALVLGSADAWAQRYTEQGVSPPVVPWLIWTGSAHGFSMSSMSQSFNSAISSASAAYAASQASSGGGFSGGSGGGGGGGGSW